MEKQHKMALGKMKKVAQAVHKEMITGQEVSHSCLSVGFPIPYGQETASFAFSGDTVVFVALNAKGEISEVSVEDTFTENPKVVHLSFCELYHVQMGKYGWGEDPPLAEDLGPHPEEGPQITSLLGELYG